MGLLDKVFVALPKSATWVPKEMFFGVALDKQGHYPMWINWGQTETHTILLALVVWDDAKRLEYATER